MKLLSTILLVLVVGFSACSQKTQKGIASETLKILSYNIHHANPPSKPDVIDLDAIAKVINESGADLVALQEVDVHTERSGKASDQAAELGKLTGMHVFFSKGIDFQGGEYGTAILSRYPLVNTQRFELPNLEGLKSEPRTLAVVTVNVGGEQLLFANTHLDYGSAENNLLQVKEIMAIFQQEERPVIIAGDFNAVPESSSVQLLDERFIRSCTEDCGYTIPEVQPKRTIDYIMLSKDANLEVVEHEVIEESYASDHRPVLAVYGFKE